MQDKKAKRLGPLIIKTALVVLTFFFLYYEIFRKHELQDLVHLYQDSYTKHSRLYWILLILMVLNWSVETHKWRLMLPEHVSLGFGKALKAVWTGVAISLFTPNRVGEFGGRLLFFKPEERVKSVAATLVGSIGQFTSTMLFGVMGTYMYMLQMSNSTSYERPLWSLLATLTLVIVLFCYFNFRKVTKWFERRRWHKKVSETFGVLSDYDRRDLAVNLFFSALRYVVFALQMGIALYVLADFVQFQSAVIAWGIMFYFLVQTVVPSVALSEIGVRGAVLAYVFGAMLIGTDTTGLILAGTLVWFVNIIIPAVIGSLFLLRVKIRTT